MNKRYLGNWAPAIFAHCQNSSCIPNLYSMLAVFTTFTHTTLQCLHVSGTLSLSSFCKKHIILTSGLPFLFCPVIFSTLLFSFLYLLNQTASRLLFMKLSMVRTKRKQNLLQTVAQVNVVPGTDQQDGCRILVKEPRSVKDNRNQWSSFSQIKRFMKRIKTVRVRVFESTLMVLNWTQLTTQ